ncbi:gephyrin-like molybdotransferase Glp [Halovivax gelatinilyticus]|uniref:molybdopterin molybdotransferase MoeA n=1 Tax=Halovivax gelatinilyticus TaxID=2961597 RepID=UPI0020CA27EA|nr:gephyrin-like molybdotransferase Glp [Halovivax gelatinilyticus]
MDGPDRDRRTAGFRERTPLSTARSTLREAVLSDSDGDVALVGRERVALTEADGRVLAQSVTADRNVPHYERAAMDGYAVRATDTHGASARSPAVVSIDSTTPVTAPGADENATSRRVQAGTAVRVHTGSALPNGADAVVMIEDVTELPAAGELEVEDAVAVGENVAPVGEDVEAGARLYEPGHRLRPSDLGLLRSVGIDSLSVARRPRVAVVPTGEELVTPGTEPGPGQVIETNGLTIARLADRWGAVTTRAEEPVTDDETALRAAIEGALDHDVIVTTGGSSVGERDLLPEVVDELGEVVVHGVALKPGHPVCLGVVEGTPVIVLPGYPVACMINAVQFLRPTLSWLVGASVPDHPTVQATLDRKLPSEPGTKTFARVSVEIDAEAEPGYRAVPTRASGSGVLSSVALADGWVIVDESREGIPAGERVDVEFWESGFVPIDG